MLYEVITSLARKARELGRESEAPQQVLEPLGGPPGSQTELLRTPRRIDHPHRNRLAVQHAAVAGERLDRMRQRA